MGWARSAENGKKEKQSRTPGSRNSKKKKKKKTPGELTRPGISDIGHGKGGGSRGGDPLSPPQFLFLMSLEAELGGGRQVRGKPVPSRFFFARIH